MAALVLGRDGGQPLAALGVRLDGGGLGGDHVHHPGGLGLEEHETNAEAAVGVQRVLLAGGGRGGLDGVADSAGRRLGRDVGRELAELLELLAAPLRACIEGDFTEAVSDLERLLNDIPDDGPTQRLLELCRRYAAEPPSGVWDGVTRYETK